MAVRQAIELGVYSLIMEGAAKGLWTFRDKAAGERLINMHLEREPPGVVAPMAMAEAQ